MKTKNDNLAKEFLFNMSHEVRTPLNVIIGMCDIARLHADDSKRVEECLKKISTAGDHLISLVDSICDITRIEWGEESEIIKEREFCTEDFIEEIRIMLEPMAVKKSIILDISAKDVINRYVIGDYSHVMQVMINLATNAIKYTPDGGFVRINIEEINNSDPGLVTYRFICSDNGIGMSQEFIKRIYEPFVRADDIRVSQIKGSGIGMAIVKGIVDVLDGTIRINSSEGIGTTVEVIFDFKAVGSEKEIRDVEEFKKKRLECIQEKKIVLIAEDESDNREVLKTYLEDLGFAVDTAISGEEAVDMFMESEPGLYKAIFMDIEMPGINGYQATMMIRGMNRDDNDIMIIAMTANAFRDYKEEAMNSGMNYYLTKPLRMERLSNFLNEIDSLHPL